MTDTNHRHLRALLGDPANLIIENGKKLNKLDSRAMHENDGNFFSTSQLICHPELDSNIYPSGSNQLEVALEYWQDSEQLENNEQSSYFLRFQNDKFFNRSVMPSGAEGCNPSTINVTPSKLLNFSTSQLNERLDSRATHENDGNFFSTSKLLNSSTKKELLNFSTQRKGGVKC